ncbi:MAG: SpoIIE family protein phosphatase, partial [Thermodesulfovibrionales bacterium]|nr:SpoIIE family protein phosphatase [Thermodesulfovibrionales bacterium]
KGIATKLILYFSISSTLIFLVIMLTNYFYSRDRFEEQISNHVKGIVSSSIYKVESVLNAVEKIPENLAFFIESGSYTEQEIQKMLMEALKINPEIFGIAVAFEPYQFKKDKYYAGYYCFRHKKELVLKPFGSDADRYFYNDWYQIARELQSPQWSEPYYEEMTLMSTYSVPIYKTISGSKRLIGIIAVDISLEWLSDIVQSVKVLKSGYGMLISQNGTIVTHPNKKYIMNETFFTIAEENNDEEMRKIGREILRNESGFFKNKRLFDINTYLIYARIPSNDWRLLLLFPENEILADIRSLNLMVAVLGFAGIITLSLVSIYISKNITRPLTILTKATEEIGKGNLDVTIPEIHSRDEVARLADSFTSMKIALKNYIAQLTTATAARERIESELRIAHDIQMNILPKTFPPYPDKKEFDIFALIEPAREVGGDFYDFFLLDENRICFLVADVSGKGVPAALFMSITKTLFKIRAMNTIMPHELLKSVNDELSESNESAMFVTVFCGILNFKTGELLYANGGHIPPVLIKSDGSVSFIEMPEGLIVGILNDCDFQSARIMLQPKDKLIVYTDGVTEAMNSANELYGSDRLLNIASRLSKKDIQTTCSEIMEDIIFFSDNAPQSDDITILCIEYRG